MKLADYPELPPWEWPKEAGTLFLNTLANAKAPQSDRLIAAELAGDLVVMNDALAEALLAVVHNNAEPEEIRARAAISLGPVLEQAYIEEFDDPDEVPITLATYEKIQTTLHQLYLDESIPKEVRRRALEGSVRSPEDWHEDAIRKQFASGDAEWILTAVFCMRFVRGDFKPLILEALKNPDPEIHGEAVHAAGSAELDEAWPHVVALLKGKKTPKPLLLAAIEASAGIRPGEAVEYLTDLAVSDDEEIAEAADEAITMASEPEEFEYDEDDEEESVH
jgi:hypothetical protein